MRYNVDPIGVSNILSNDQQDFKTSINVYTNQLIGTYLCLTSCIIYGTSSVYPGAIQYKSLPSPKPYSVISSATPIMNIMIQLLKHGRFYWV